MVFLTADAEYHTLFSITVPGALQSVTALARLAAPQITADVCHLTRPLKWALFLNELRVIAGRHCHSRRTVTPPPLTALSTVS